MGWLRWPVVRARPLQQQAAPVPACACLKGPERVRTWVEAVCVRLEGWVMCACVHGPAVSGGCDTGVGRGGCTRFVWLLGSCPCSRTLSPALPSSLPLYQPAAHAPPFITGPPLRATPPLSPQLLLPPLPRPSSPPHLHHRRCARCCWSRSRATARGRCWMGRRRRTSCRTWRCTRASARRWCRQAGWMSLGRGAEGGWLAVRLAGVRLVGWCLPALEQL